MKLGGYGNEKCEYVKKQCERAFILEEVIR